MPRTKIICTLGPAVDAPETLERLIRSGMDVARFNFSHGNHAQHAERFARLQAAAARVGKPVAAMQDLCGPKLRVGTIMEGVILDEGAQVTLTLASTVGTAECIPLPIPEFFAVAAPGMRLLLDDGLLELQVETVESESVVCRVIAGGVLSSGKGVNLPGVPLSVAAVTEKDEADLKFGLALGVDYVALSFVRDVADVHRLRALMEQAGRVVPILVKIEKAEALENLDAILDAADGAMVARGDLGVELPVEEMAMVQKRLIRACNRLGKPVITATQMLDSMIRNPRPTRAEVTDIANAILDGTDALMLSGETAVGAHPIQAVETMARIARRTEEQLDYDQLLRDKTAIFGRESVTDAVAEAAVTIAHDLQAAVILCATESGGTARSVAKFRPKTQVVAVTPSPETCRRLALFWGVQSLLMPVPTNVEGLLSESAAAAAAAGYLKIGSLFVLTSGTPLGKPGSTNLIKVHSFGEPL
ncbi:pyruvate kinase [Armatimonas sp.]|uniref:pyruvate kinase n=1 Tax=Armatimonas sp. TaxID=1872638 RepID=UPI00286ABF83|nr:pyruvate kinase [Armatimonas sp.]